MKRIKNRIASRRNRTPGKQLEQDELGSAVGGGCCAQGCKGCFSDPIGPLDPLDPIGPLPKFP
ncbi:MAG: hypothetical protein R6X02_15830 [Enhygromyxa sp.]